MEKQNTKSLTSQSLTLQELPTEILFKIFRYLPSNQHLALVCHRFYQIICEIERNFHSMCIDNIMVRSLIYVGIIKIKLMQFHLQLLDSNVYSSIINSARIIDTIKIITRGSTSSNFWENLKSIILKYRHNLKNLDINVTETSNLLNILYLLPQDCPEQLSLANVDASQFKRFLSQHKVKKLSIIGAVTDSSILENVELTYLKLTAPKNNINEIIRSQKLNLKCLKIVGDDVSKIDYTLLNLPNINSLDIPILEITSLTTSECVEKLNNLEKLTSLSFQSKSNFTHDFCNSLKFPMLKELDVSILNELINDDAFNNLSQNFPNLNSFSVRTAMALKFFRHFCLNLKMQLESLLIENIFYGYVGITILPSMTFVSQNLYLKKLILLNKDQKVIICKNDLVKCLKIFSNLEFLVISGNFDTQDSLETVLKSLLKLRELVIVANQFYSTTYVMSIVKELGKKLRLIVFEKFNFKCEVESLKTFFGDQFQIVVKKNSNLILKKSGFVTLREYF